MRVLMQISAETRKTKLRGKCMRKTCKKNISQSEKFSKNIIQVSYR